MINKSLKASKIALILDENEDEIFIGHNKLLGDDQEIVEEVE